jgi:uncharacterized protein (DUF302 family)/uncharacterized membrane protein YidH (DUF202 family)
MSDRTDAAPRVSLSDLLAAERTYLAWLRTGLASMGFGFVVARFGLYLQEIQFAGRTVLPRGYSVVFGTALIALGVAVCLLATWHHLRLVRELRRGEEPPPRPLAQAGWFGLLLALVGLAMAIYLISTRGSASGGAEEGGQMAAKGIIDKASNHSVEETVSRLEDLLRSRSVKVFALIDHSGEAEKAGMKMRPTKLLVFGNPSAGTPLMLAAPSVAIDLPLKILVWEDSDGKVWVSYNSSEYLRARHGLPDALLGNIAVVEKLAAKAAE